MSDSIRDQLLKLGLKPSPKPEVKPQGPRPQGSGRAQGSAPAQHGKPGAPHRPNGPHGRSPNSGQPGSGKPGPANRPAHAGQQRPQAAQGKPHPTQRPAHAGPRPPQRTREEMDLAKAYALRAQAERAEAEELKRAAEEKARQKKERKERLQRLLDGQALNLPETAAEQPRHFEHRGKIRRVYVDDAQLAAINQGELGIVQLEARYLIVPRALAEEVASFAPDMLAVLLSPGEAEAVVDVPADAPVAIAAVIHATDEASDGATAPASGAASTEAVDPRAIAD